MAIVRNIQNDDLYRYLGNNKFRNIRTGVEGVIDNESAKRVFKINAEMTVLCNEYPIIEEMVKKIGLKFNNNKK